ncbi:MAG TPA: DUF6600 domain-containing protein [Steroidobacteraceae bacterium]|nr:DUF6600 domain-containing protein [Steroidobacteraceae bacterium]
MRVRALSICGAIATGMLFGLSALGAALAQESQEQQPPQGDDSQLIEHLGEDSDPGSNPPGRVAQLSYAEGSVSLEPAGADNWTTATLNRPLTLGDKLWSDQSSRAELDIGDAVIRLGSSTGFSFLNLDDQTAQMQVTAGTVIVHVRTLANGEHDEIDTPNLALTLNQPGTYRVEVSDSGDTTIVKVDDGDALATGGGQSYPIAAQQSVTFTGTSTLAADFATLGAPDSLDDWSMQREQQVERQAAVAQQYVPPDMVGADDLGSYGTWESTTDWGYAWFPTVAVGWAPYSLGRWVWISPWGWTWVDQEPWGFAPFHYGRWGRWHDRWCWVPGPRRVHPFYAPALVGWVGGARGRPGAHVGWFPLGPRDVYVPGYRVSPAYVRNINVANARYVNTTYINNVYEGRVHGVHYVNSGVPGAITAVPRNVFTSAEAVGPHRVILPHRGGLNMRAVTAAPAIAPVRQSILGVNDGRIVRTPPRAIMNRPVVARLAPPRAPVSFTREQAAIRANGGRPVPVAELARMRPVTPAAPVRFASPPGTRPSALELRTAPDGRFESGRPGMAAREHALQQPTLPPGQPQRNDRPSWAGGRSLAPGAPMVRPGQQTFAPRERPLPQREAPLEWHTPPQRQAAPQPRFVQPQHQAPAVRFAPPPRQIPEQHFNTPERRIPEQRFSPPPQRFAPPPERQPPQQRFAPPAERQPPQQRFMTPGFRTPSDNVPHYSMPRAERAPAPRAEPARPPPASRGGTRPPR